MYIGVSLTAKIVNMIRLFQISLVSVSSQKASDAWVQVI